MEEYTGITIDELDGMTLPEIEELYQATYDRWCWETGSPEDKADLDNLEKHIKYLKKEILAIRTNGTKRLFIRNDGIILLI